MRAVRTPGAVVLLATVLSACSGSTAASSAVSPACAAQRSGGIAGVDWCTRWRSVGYDLHITRADDWVDSASHPIAEAEWLAVARSDPRIRPTEDPATFTWSDSGGPSMWFTRGQIVVKGVRSQVEIDAIAAVASGLAANLVGDDGEHYPP